MTTATIDTVTKAVNCQSKKDAKRLYMKNYMTKYRAQKKFDKNKQITPASFNPIHTEA